MSSVISGLIGGLISLLLTIYIVRRVGRSAPVGTLRFGPLLWILAFGCLAFALLPIGLYIFTDDRDQLLPRLLLLIGFGVGAIYCAGEAAFVRGTYNDEKIVFSSPWTGTKTERWSDLESIEFNGWLSWYTLSFKSGARIRLSSYLSGHLSVLDLLSHERPEP